MRPRSGHFRGVFLSIATVLVVGCGGALMHDNDAGGGDGEAGGNGDGGTSDGSAIDADCADAGGGASCDACNPCPVVLNGADTCTSGACVILCDPGFGRFNGHCHRAH